MCSNTTILSIKKNLGISSYRLGQISHRPLKLRKFAVSSNWSRLVPKSILGRSVVLRGIKGNDVINWEI